MDEKELDGLIEAAVDEIMQWAQKESPSVIDREMLESFALPIGIAHLKPDISPEDLANMVILCLIAAYNLGANSVHYSAVKPSAIKLDD